MNLIKAIRTGLTTNNFYASLFTALAIPDICAALERGRTSARSYSTWWEEYMVGYKGYMSGNDTYALRCAILHQGKSNIVEQPIREFLEYFIFTTGTEAHLIHVAGVALNKGKPETFLQLNVTNFCEDVCVAAEKWIVVASKKPAIAERMKRNLEIHEPGYVHREVLKFE